MKVKKYSPGFIIVLLAILFMSIYLIDRKYYSNRGNNPSSIASNLSTATISATPTINPTPTIRPSQESALPDSFLIDDFPFQSQAPFANWDELHDEACEEASIILVKWWQDNLKSISAETMDQEILKMVDWQVKNWGAHNDLNAQKTQKLAQEIYELKLSPKYDISLDDIKKEVSQNHPIIVPTAGRMLGNPNFRSPGPIYHMVVVIGYSSNNIIVQDVGTRRGDHYQYNEKIFFNAIHDWPGSADEINSGQKAILVLGS